MRISDWISDVCSSDLWQAGTTDITELLKYNFPAGLQTWLWLAAFAAFAVKMPMWPVHTWLPDAHVQAPTAGSVLLAGVMLKLGGRSEERRGGKECVRACSAGWSTYP